MSRIWDFAQERGLKPENEGQPSARALCPNAGQKHYLNIDTVNDRWKCPNCRKEGTVNELEQWILQLDQQKLSDFMKETGEKGSIQTEETFRWWMNRY